MQFLPINIVCSTEQIPKLRYLLDTSQRGHTYHHTHEKTTLYKKKKGEPRRKLALEFDFTMDNFDGAETYELVSPYLLSQLQYLDINVGLYRVDELAVTKQSAKEAESIKKKTCKIFKDNGLNITIGANKKKQSNFLDIS
ncbi:hypothetical protein PoB_005343900 [Plakobranchus ocellatus]|uniref:Uncharacterized protein n=1 Tax=Plakobranchus ocellatus TaxID=259542 RepID=A0AAV4C788_9GAST|nr:hypothetical protein PoB_005343900 [Plakobranchus ocellatus]